MKVLYRPVKLRSLRADLQNREASSSLIEREHFGIRASVNVPEPFST